MFDVVNDIFTQMDTQTTFNLVEVSLLALIIFSIIYVISILKKISSVNSLPLLVIALKGKEEDFYNTKLINKGLGAARIIGSEPLYMIIKNKKQIFRLDFDVNAIDLVAAKEKQNILPLVTKNGEEISLNEFFLTYINSKKSDIKTYPLTIAFKDIFGQSYFINFSIDNNRLVILDGPIKYYFSHKYLRLKLYLKNFIIISYFLFIWKLKR